MVEQFEHAHARRERWLWALAVALVAFVPRIGRAWESREDILVRSTWDDTYYYFAIARNIMRGNGASFDGENITNGFHPLWLALITPFWAFGGDTPIHLVLTLGALFGAITAAVIFLWLKSVTGNTSAALLGAAFFALHPEAVSDSVNGLESSLAVMMLALSLLALNRLECGGSSARVQGAAMIFGEVLGLLLLSRTDMIFVAGAMLAFFVLRAGRSGILRPAAAGSVATLCVLPWLMWSYVATGSIVQISGRAGGVVLRQGYEKEHGSGLEPRLRHGADLAWNIFKSDLPHSYFIRSDHPAWPALVGGAFIVVFIGWTATRARGTYRDGALALAVVIFGLLATLAYHGGVRFFMRSWYFTPMALAGALALGLVVDAAARFVDERMPRLSLVRRADIRSALYVGATAILLVAYQPNEPMGWTGEHPHELNTYAGARWLAQNTPMDTRAGGFNSGVVGYFSERTVVNLDGVVNEKAYNALKMCRVTEYVRDERLDYVVDFGEIMFARCGPPVVTYDLVATLGNPNVAYGAVSVLAVHPAPP